MEERIDVWDAEGKTTGKTALKKEAHLKGLWHPTVHVWIYSPAGKVLLQQRAQGKDTFPGLWDVSVAGHMETGESPIAAALREIKEEIGIDVDPSRLELKGVFPSEHRHPGGIVDREFHHCFIYELTPPLPRFELQESEVAALKWEPLIAFAEAVWGLANPGPYVPHSRDYYAFVVREIKSGLKRSSEGLPGI